MEAFYLQDLQEGKIDAEFAKELLQCFYLKIGEYFCVSDHWYAVSFAGYPMWQVVMLGGQDENGADATKEISYICLDAAQEIKLTQPPIAVRYHDKTPEKLIRKGVEMIQQGLANPAFFNDNVIIPMVLDKGGNLQEARDWIIIGCVEPHEGLGGTDGSPTGGYMNGLKCLELALHDGVDPLTKKQIGLKTGDPTQFATRKDIVEAVESQLIYFWDKIHTGYSIVVPHHMLRLPVMYASMVIGGCVENGKSVQEGGARHNHVGTFFCGPANVADSIVAIDEIVFKEKILSMKELIDILDADFEGNERIRQLLLNKPPKFGNDNADVDGLARNIINYCARHVQNYRDIRGGTWCLCNLSQTVNISYGEMVGATPDGRKARQPLSDNASPAMGRDISGPTATVKSVGNLDQVYNHDGTLFNLRFDPRGVQGEKGRDIIEGVIKTYFKHMGCHIQINVIDTDTLRKAQKDPEHYRDIVVRVAGYMAYFTELDKVAQDTLIERTAHLA
jgi:formate C-acetyltransferase